MCLEYLPVDRVVHSGGRQRGEDQFDSGTVGFGSSRRSEIAAVPEWVATASKLKPQEEEEEEEE